MQQFISHHQNYNLGIFTQRTILKLLFCNRMPILNGVFEGFLIFFVKLFVNFPICIAWSEHSIPNV